MTTLITILISLLGYGTPSDFDHLTEDELTTQIENAENLQDDDDGGVFGDWDSPGAADDDINGGD